MCALQHHLTIVLVCASFSQRCGRGYVLSLATLPHECVVAQYAFSVHVASERHVQRAELFSSV